MSKEKEFHRRFEKELVHGQEWFDFSLDLLFFIIELNTDVLS